jgi:hypothetical protein
LKTVYIHIGLGRCGTTSIQRALFAGRQSLREEGYLYTKTDPGGEAHHTLCPLKKELISGGKLAWNKIAEDFIKSTENNLIISSENLTGVPDEIVAHIAELFSSCAVRILFLGRDQTDLLPSIFSQWTKAAIRFESFESFFEATKELWHFPKLLDRWRELFGIESIRCHFLKKNENAVSVFAGFFEDTQCRSILNGGKNERLNSSLSSELLKLIFLYDNAHSNHLPIWREFPGWDVIEPVSHEAFCDDRVQFLAEIERLSSMIPSPPQNIINSQVYTLIKSTYAESNHSFLIEYCRSESVEIMDSSDNQ